MDRVMTGKCLHYVTAAVAASMALMTGLVSAEARPLKKEACDALVHERKQLASLGTEKAIIKGPEWARANMPATMMQHVRRYLIVEEMLLFRCKGVNLPELLLQQASATSVVASKKQKKPATAQSIKPPPPLPKIKPVTSKAKTAKVEAPVVAEKDKQPKQAKKEAVPTKDIKTAAISVKAQTAAAAPSQGGDVTPAAAVVPLPDRKPTPAERIAYAKAIAEAARRAAILRKKKLKASRVTTPDIQQQLLWIDSN